MNEISEDKLFLIDRNAFSLKTYAPSELMGMNVIWKRNFLGMVKGVIIEFNEIHAAAVNGHKTLFLKKDEIISLRETLSDNDKITYFVCKLVDTGKLFYSIENVRYENKISKYCLKRGGVDLSYKLVIFNENGYLETFICRSIVDVVKRLKLRIKEHNKYWDENTLFDRVMKKYFSFYK